MADWRNAAFDAHKERVQLEREAGKRSLSRFIKMAWRHVDQAKLSWNWHIDAVADHLEAVSKGELRNLIINEPPGAMKSLEVSVFWNAWDWIQDPSKAFLYTSFDGDLTRRDAGKVQELITSEWFQERWGQGYMKDGKLIPGVRLDPDEATGAFNVHDGYTVTAKHPYGKPTGGWRFSTSVGGKTTGWHPDRRVIDDPTKPKDVTKENLAANKQWYQNTFSSRKRDPNTVATVVIMQRLAEDDLAGYLLETGEFTHLMIPLEYEAKRAYSTPWGKDPRTVEGESFWKDRFTPKAIKEIHRDMPDPAIRGAQYQQNPVPDSGSVFRKEWLTKRWSHQQGFCPATGEVYATLPSTGIYIMSWDFTFKGHENTDWVVGQVWLHHGVDFYLVDQVREQADFRRAAQMVVEFNKKWPLVSAKVVEDKANGPAIMSHLKGKIGGFVPYDPKSESKVARARAATPYWADGHVYLPADAEWLGDLVVEHIRFPKGKNDDQVDCGSQAIAYMTGGTSIGEFLAAMEALKG